MRRFLMTFAALSLLTTSLQIAAEGTLSVGDPYIRAVPPGQTNSAAFMTIENRGDEPRALVAAESSASGVVELHTHLEEDGMMKMRRVDRIDLPAGETVTLEPGGLHLMLIGLTQDLKPGDELELTLIYDDDGRQQIKVPVRQIKMMQKHH